MINVDLLERPVQEILIKSGWYQGRKIDVSNWINELTKEGYKFSAYANDLLEEIGGLCICPERIKFGKTYPGDADFNAYSAGSGEFDRLEIFEMLSKEPLFPLGMVFGQWFLYVGESKKVYMGDVNQLFLLGNSFEEFLNNLIMGNEVPKSLSNE